MRELFGSAGVRGWKFARGIDECHIVPKREAKSISHETTLAGDIDDIEVLRTVLLNLVLVD